MRGLSFKISNPKGLPLVQILKCVEVKNYYWYVVPSQNDTWDSCMEQLLFNCDTYDGLSFYDTIKQDHFVIFLKLQAYFSRGKNDEILSYEDFQKSECQLLLLIYDCCYVDIYLKDQAIIEELYQHALSSGYQAVHYITDDNDTRTKMDVL